MLWLGIHFPRLPLEVFTRTLRADRPQAVIAGEGRRRGVAICNTPAARLGIHAGMPVGAACALGDVLLLERRRELEQAALERLAIWSGCFTSLISLVSPDVLLLEIAGSLKLFGGKHGLLERIGEGIRALGYLCRMAAAPTPLAAEWLARAGHERYIRDVRDLPGQLADLPLVVLDLEARQLESLRGMGLGRIGDLLRLPRSGLARRLGPCLIEQLDRALGAVPDPRRRFEIPEHFTNTIELAEAVENAQALLFIAHRQLLELAGFLQARCSGVQRLNWRFAHRHRPPSTLSLGLLAPCRDPGHLVKLLQERLQAFTLPAPVETLTLTVEAVQPWEETSKELFAEAPPRAAQRISLVERLQARLGSEAVTGICLVPEHRPERAWRVCSPGERSLEPVRVQRPLWLLAHPLPLPSDAAGRPVLDGRLRLRSHCERIEAGWWDGKDTARDYFLADNPAGSCFWIFKDLQRGGWYLHGIFE